VEYNNFVKTRTVFADPIRVIRFAALLWIGYVAALAILSWSLAEQRPGMPVNTPYYSYYYVFLAFVALLCLGLSYWPWIQGHLGRGFVPAIITIITVMPILATWVIIRFFPPNPVLDTGTSVLRLLPFFLVGFLLVAWQYGWQYTLLIILGTAGLNLAVIWSFSEAEPRAFSGAHHRHCGADHCVAGGRLLCQLSNEQIKETAAISRVSQHTSDSLRQHTRATGHYQGAKPAGKGVA
jgi:hypothetical protein